MSLVIFVKNFSAKDQIIMILSALILSAVLANAQCTHVPLTNSTVVTDKKVLSSIYIDFNIKDLTKMCFVNAYGSKFDVKITSWSNNFKLDCYETDDPIMADDSMKLNGELTFVDKSICSCVSVRLLNEACDNVCKGNRICMNRVHNCESCAFVPTGVNSRYRKDICFQGFTRFKVCKVEPDDSFNINYLITKNENGTDSRYVEYAHTGQKSVVDDDGIKVTTITRQDDSFVGKYVILDSKLTDKFWLVDKKYVNDEDERDIRKIGWFRKGDDEYHLELIKKQLNVNIKDCVKNEMDIKEDPLEIAKFLDSEKDFLFGDGHGMVITNNGEKYYSQGEKSSEFEKYSVMKYGFMVKNYYGVVEFVGINKDDKVLSTHAGVYINSPFMTNFPVVDNFANTCKDTIDSTYIQFNSDSFLDVDNKEIFISTYKSSSRNCFKQVANKEGTLVKQFTTKLWPSDEWYTCIRDEHKGPNDEGTGMYVCKRDDTLNNEERSFVFKSFRDNSFVEFYLQSTDLITTKELELPEISDSKITCENGDCKINIVKTKGNYITINFDDCFNSVITDGLTENLVAYSDCNKVVRTSVNFQNQIIHSSLDEVNVTKSINVRLTDSRKRSNLDLNIDYSGWIVFLKYWYIYVIIVGIALCALISAAVIYFSFKKKLIQEAVINAKRVVYSKKYL